MKDTSKLAATLLLVFAFCGCGKNESQQPAANAKTLQCANNLRSIDAVKKHWAEQGGADSNATPTWDDLAPFFRHDVPTCPEGGTYTIGTVGEVPTCSIAAHNDYFRDHVLTQP